MFNRLIRQWGLEPEGGALAGFALYAVLKTVHLENGFGDGQAQAGSRLSPSVPAAVAPVEQMGHAVVSKSGASLASLPPRLSSLALDLQPHTAPAPLTLLRLSPHGLSPPL